MANKAYIFLTKMVEVLEDPNTTLLSDKDIFYLVNSELPKKHRISMSYFEFLKSPNQDHPKSISQNTTLTEEDKEDFISALRVARIKQKMHLTAKAFDDKLKNAYPYLWSLERKNTDLQLRKNNDAPVNQPLIQITASSDEHKVLIDSILSGKSIELQPKVKEEPNYDDAEYLEIIDNKEEDINPQIDNE
ncbi:hypothetical protein [Psychroserpens mesophilus]|uniref:hypothetical protein n=1 Tax=Psychroserpens mesophilus TaxID=325473 RepID=UPI003D64E8BE